MNALERITGALPAWAGGAGDREVEPAPTDMALAKSLLEKASISADDEAWLRGAIERNGNDPAVQGFIAGVGAQLEARARDRANAAISASSADMSQRLAAEARGRLERWLALSPRLRATIVLHDRRRADEISKALLALEELAESDAIAAPPRSFEPGL